MRLTSPNTERTEAKAPRARRAPKYLTGIPIGRQPIGEPARHAYRQALRADPCAYCATAPKNLHTLDHIRPRRPQTGPRGTNAWYNLTGACEPCNGAKGNRSLLLFLASRSTRHTDPPLPTL